MNKIREYILVKDKVSHAMLEEVGCYKYEGELQYTDTIYEMLTDVFRMDRLLIEVSYVIALDYAKKPKGICKIGQGDSGETPMPLDSMFTFLLLTGANSFVIAHNHVSGTPEASKADKRITLQVMNMASTFGIDFVGHMIINPNGYIIEGGSMDGAVGELDENGNIYGEEPFDESENITITGNETEEELMELCYKKLKAMSKRLDKIEAEV